MRQNLHVYRACLPESEELHIIQEALLRNAMRQQNHALSAALSSTCHQASDGNEAHQHRAGQGSNRGCSWHLRVPPTVAAQKKQKVTTDAMNIMSD